MPTIVVRLWREWLSPSDSDAPRLNIETESDRYDEYPPGWAELTAFERRERSPFEDISVDERGRIIVRYTHPDWNPHLLGLYATGRWDYVESQINARNQRHRGAKAVAAAREIERQAIRRALEHLQGEKQISQAAAARLYLQQHDHEWNALSDDARRKRVAAVLRRLRGRAERTPLSLVRSTARNTGQG